MPVGWARRALAQDAHSHALRLGRDVHAWVLAMYSALFCMLWSAHSTRMHYRSCAESHIPLLQTVILWGPIAPHVHRGAAFRKARHARSKW